MVKIFQQKVVVRLASLDNAKNRTKALKTAASMNGVTSVSLDRDRLTVICDGTDVISLTVLLRKKLGYADLISVTTGDHEKIKEDKEIKPSSIVSKSAAPYESGMSKSVAPYEYGYPYPYPYAYGHENIYGTSKLSKMM